MKEVVLQCGIRPQDRVLMDFECGSMQWYWMVSALSTGAAIVLYQGDSEGLARAAEASGRRISTVFALLIAAWSVTARA